MTNKRPNKTALMIFSLSARTEEREKVLFGRHQKTENRTALQWLINRTTTIAKASGLPTIWIDEKKQVGESFGERFTNAFREVFAEGYDQVIAIGNDCPDLSVEIIAEAQQRVEENKTVLGPTFDGGDYLIALSKNHFNASEFQALPWNTHDLHTALFQQITAQQGEAVCLNVLTDIDDKSALQTYLNGCPDSSFARLIKQLLQKEKTNLIYTAQIVERMLYALSNPLRAPPTCYY